MSNGFAIQGSVLFFLTIAVYKKQFPNFNRPLLTSVWPYFRTTNILRVDRVLKLKLFDFQFYDNLFKEPRPNKGEYPYFPLIEYSIILLNYYTIIVLWGKSLRSFVVSRFSSVALKHLIKTVYYPGENINLLQVFENGKIEFALGECISNSPLKFW